MNTDKKILLKSDSRFKKTFELWWRKLKLKTAFSHLGLLLTLMIYTTLGGFAFRALEHPAETARLQAVNDSLYRHRLRLVATVINSQRQDLANLTAVVASALGVYELALQDAVYGGLQVVKLDQIPARLKGKQDISFTKNVDVIDEDWTLVKAVFFSSTVLTTIGYGNMVPQTLEGRVFCMLFALVGIPLTLTVIADWGRMFATAVSSLMKHLPSPPDFFRKANVTHRRSLYALGAVCFLFVYLAAGAALFVIWEDDWTFFDGFYFCFVTMTTIGFGDLVPKKPKYMLLCTLYILFGLALTSTIIELVRRQYAQSWRRLQALRGPLADTLRRIGDAAGGGIAADVSALQQDLKRVLTVVTMPRWTTNSGNDAHIDTEKSNKQQKEWEEAVEAVIRDITKETAQKQPSPLVQIVIYESSV